MQVLAEEEERRRRTCQPEHPRVNPADMQVQTAEEQV